MSLWRRLWVGWDMSIPVLFPIIAFTVSIALPRRAIRRLLRLPLQIARSFSGGRTTMSITGNLYISSLVDDVSLKTSWEKFRGDLMSNVKNKKSSEEDDYYPKIEVKICMQFTTIMCWIGLNGKLFDFRYLESKSDHSIQASCDCAFVCFRPQEKLPVYITDLSNEDDIVCAYIHPIHDTTGTYKISISEKDGAVMCNFSCSLGSHDDENNMTFQKEKESVCLPPPLPVKTVTAPPIITNKHSSHIPIEAIMATRCPISYNEAYHSPEITRKSPLCSMTTTSELENDLNLDSPISLAGNLSNERQLKTKTMSQSAFVVVDSIPKVRRKEEKSLNSVAPPTTRMESTNGVSKIINKQTTFPSFRKFSGEEILAQEKAKSIHENIKQDILNLGYSKEETAAVKCCLTEFTKEKHPDLNNFERSEKVQSYVRRDIIDTLDIDKRLSAIRSSKIKKWAADR